MADLTTFTLYDLGVRLRADEATRALAAEALHGLGLSPGDEAATWCDVRVEAVSTLSKLSATPQARAGEEALYRRGDKAVLATPHYQAGLDAARRTADVHVRLGEPAQLVASIHAAVVRSTLALWRYDGVYTLHAACLTPSEAEAPGVVLAAPSGSGKSTLALGLLRAGWRYLSDDLVLLHADEEHVEARALLRTFGVVPHADVVFPEIARHTTQRPPFAKVKWDVDVEALHAGRRRLRCVPRVLLFPQIAGRDASALEPAEPLAALRLLLSQLNLVPTLETEVAQQQLTMASQLLGQTHVFHLHAGRDLHAHPERAADLLLPLLSTTV